jgi:prevent-host-death family protein
METLAISKFKATCLGVLEQVRRSGEPVLITKRGEPIAEVVPTSRPAEGKRQLGVMAGTAEVVGDLSEPMYTDEEWAAVEQRWLDDYDEQQAETAP